MTPNFTLTELTKSSTAERLSINNTPSDVILINLQTLAEGLEEVRKILNNPMSIDSGFRCIALNKAVGGASNSAHTLGFAADFTCPAFGKPLAIVNKIVDSGLKFDQIIQEGTWVHISFAPAMRRNILTAIFSNGHITYKVGL